MTMTLRKKDLEKFIESMKLYNIKDHAIIADEKDDSQLTIIFQIWEPYLMDAIYFAGILNGHKDCNEAIKLIKENRVI